MFSSARRLPSPLRLALAGAAVLCLAAPFADASAATRYAAPTGTGPSPCLATAPCSIENALSNAEGLANGDTVLLAPGTYLPAGELAVFRQSVTVSGEPGRPAPLIDAAGARGLFLPNPESTVRDVRIHSPSTTSYGLAVTQSEGVVERVESTGEAGTACALSNADVRDSVCVSTSGTGVFSSLGAGVPVSQQLNLFNVTAIGGAYGVVAQASEFAAVTVAATNTIVVGGNHDAEARSTAVTSSAAITLAHSNFDDTMTEGVNATVSAPTENANQSAEPLFVDAAGGDYREAEGSPTRLAGDLAVVLPAELDLAGNSRTTNCAGTVGVDIGAYQYECPPPPGAPLPLEETPPPGNSTPPDNRVPCACLGPGPERPRLSKLTLKPAKFTATGKAPKGTTISFTLSIAASVKFELLTKKTVKGKKPKTVSIGSLSLPQGKAGTNKVKFAGKLKGKPLDTGKYTLRATATASGLGSAPLTTTFVVLAAP